MDVLVISPCSGTKRFDAVISHEEIDSRERTELLREYPDSVASAAEIYTGREHGHIQSAVDRLSEVANVDWRIISAGFGVLSSSTEIPSYECTFNEIEQVRERAERFGLDVEMMTNNRVGSRCQSGEEYPSRPPANLCRRLRLGLHRVGDEVSDCCSGSVDVTAGRDGWIRICV